jgi:hypothetical protein
MATTIKKNKQTKQETKKKTSQILSHTHVINLSKNFAKQLETLLKEFEI